VLQEVDALATLQSPVVELYKEGDSPTVIRYKAGEDTE
jgi:hypothetical protein